MTRRAPPRWMLLTLLTMLAAGAGIASLRFGPVDLSLARLTASFHEMRGPELGLRPDGSALPSSGASPRGLRYAWTSPHTTHWTRRTSSSYMLMIVCVVSALHRGDGQ